MKCLLPASGLLLASLLCVSAITAPPNDPSKPVMIPLDKIWAFNMPGTRDIRELEPDKFGEQVRKLSSEQQVRLLHESLTQQIRDALPFLTADEKLEARPGFVVSGNDAVALKQAHAVLAKKEKLRNRISAGHEIYIVFFSHLFGDYIHLEQVERRGNTIHIRYRFVPHTTANMSQHFAIIPVGKLPIGTYQVDITQLPMKSKYVVQSDRHVPFNIVRRVVCEPFSFSVVEREANRPAN